MYVGGEGGGRKVERAAAAAGPRRPPPLHQLQSCDTTPAPPQLLNHITAKRFQKLCHIKKQSNVLWHVAVCVLVNLNRWLVTTESTTLSHRVTDRFKLLCVGTNKQPPPQGASGFNF